MGDLSIKDFDHWQWWQWLCIELIDGFASGSTMR